MFFWFCSVGLELLFQVAVQHRPRCPRLNSGSLWGGRRPAALPARGCDFLTGCRARDVGSFGIARGRARGARWAQVSLPPPLWPRPRSKSQAGGSRPHPPSSATSDPSPHPVYRYHYGARGAGVRTHGRLPPHLCQLPLAVPPSRVTRSPALGQSRAPGRVTA